MFNIYIRESRPITGSGAKPFHLLCPIFKLKNIFVCIIENTSNKAVKSFGRDVSKDREKKTGYFNPSGGSQFH